MIHSTNPFLIIDLASTGVSLVIFDELAKISHFTKAEIADFIGLNAKTVANYKKNEKQLIKTEAEHLIMLKELFELGKSVFGSYKEFSFWLEKPSFGLDLRIPKTLLNYISGIDLVKRELIRIEFGDFS